jgi:beta-galactosidase/beta-glucuronidase
MWFPLVSPLPCNAAIVHFRFPLATLACLAALAALSAPARAQTPVPEQPPPPLEVQRPQGKPLIREGQVGRVLLGGRWYFRQDDSLLTGDAERWYAQDDLAGWTAITVPHNWNAKDTTENRATVGWYRKEFTLPRSPKKALHFWKVRFEGSNYRTKVWLNGRVIGGQTGLFPFEAELEGLRAGRNTLVVKVSTLRSNTDLTHWRPAAYNGFGSGGWWNFGGLLREVYVRRLDAIDIEDVHVLPHLPRVGGSAKVEVRVKLRNFTDKDRFVRLRLAVDGERFDVKPETVLARNTRELSTRFTLERPRLWQPGRPELYPLTVSAATVTKRRSDKKFVDPVPRAVYRLNFGVRKLETRPGGALLLNGRRLNLRGASIHEDDLEEGGALSQGTRNLLVYRLRNLGATVTRSHYPLHPAFIEAFDRLGILYWVQAPVYQLPNSFWSRVRPAATRAAVLTVRNNVNHASIFSWSLANEPGGNRSELGVIGPDLVRYIREASAAVREIDDTRLVAIDRQSRVGEPLWSPAYNYLDVLGVNEYFGWYDSYRADLVRPPTTLDELGPFLDSVHAANPDLPLVITEFGAEATGSGPAEQPGTYEFQRRFVRDHLAVHASKRYVHGSIHWALRDFRVEPTWLGGAPPEWATPPWHNKSLIEENNGRKDAYFEMRRRWRATPALR